jgi:hypothetical protein
MSHGHVSCQDVVPSLHTIKARSPPQADKLNRTYNLWCGGTKLNQTTLRCPVRALADPAQWLEILFESCTVLRSILTGVFALKTDYNPFSTGVKFPKELKGTGR